jgi:hypothetical protein
VKNTPQNEEVSKPLKEAAKQLEIAFCRLGKLGPGGSKVWIGAWGDYKKIAKLMVKVRTLAENVERKEKL